ncbi:MAG: cyclopropane-fatty-acyl-phospholipid synthase family protein [Desulforhopalus sp.]
MNNVMTTEHYPQDPERSFSLTNKFAKAVILRMLGGIQHGQIILQDGENCQTYGNDQNLQATVTVCHPDFYKKVLFGGSIGGGEAYIAHFWEVDDLTKLVRIMVLNMELLDRMEQGFAFILRPFHLLRHIARPNSKRQAKSNILSHYDLGNEMYQSFLDPTMMYSSAIYPREGSTLEEASLHKLDVICQKMELKPTDRVIEIGAGWGGFAIHAARNYGCHVTTTTISEAQFTEAQKRISEAGLADKITLLQKDYRDLTGQYDKLVSIEMIEAVGHKYLPEFFSKCSSLLKEDGMMFLQAIIISDQKYEEYVHSVDFIQRYIFPGGCLPSKRRMLDLLSAKTDMVAHHLEDYGVDYARTLRDWRMRFNNAFASLKNHGYDETFRRLWEFYFCYCEGGFLEQSINVVHLMARRPAQCKIAKNNMNNY